MVKNPCGTHEQWVYGSSYLYFEGNKKSCILLVIILSRLTTEKSNPLTFISYAKGQWDYCSPDCAPNTMMGTLFLLYLAAQGFILSTSAQDLLEICYEKLQIGNFPSEDVRKWWKYLIIPYLDLKISMCP